MALTASQGKSRKTQGDRSFDTAEPVTTTCKEPVITSCTVSAPACRVFRLRVLLASLELSLEVQLELSIPAYPGRPVNPTPMCSDMFLDRYLRVGHVFSPTFLQSLRRRMCRRLRSYVLIFRYWIPRFRSVHRSCGRWLRCREGLLPVLGGPSLGSSFHTHLFPGAVRRSPSPDIRSIRPERVLSDRH